MIARELLKLDLIVRRAIRNVQALQAVLVDDLTSLCHQPLLIETTVTGELLQRRLVLRTPIAHIQAFSAPVVDDLALSIEKPALIGAFVATVLLHSSLIGKAAISHIQTLAGGLIDDVQYKEDPDDHDSGPGQLSGGDPDDPTRRVGRITPDNTASGIW